MPSCIVRGCKNYVYKNGSATKNRHKIFGHQKRVTYHSFPKDVARRQIWAENLQVANIKDSYRVCSDHFPAESFDRMSQSYIKLLGNAVPMDLRTIPIATTSSDDNPSDPSLREISFACDEPSIKRRKMDTVDATKSQATQTEEKYTGLEKTYVDQQTSISPERLSNSPTKNQIRQHYNRKIDSYRKRIRFLCQKLRRYQKKNVSLDQVLDELKSKRLLQEDQVKELSKIGNRDTVLLQHHIRKVSKLKSKKNYSPELRQFALTLHFYSAAAYSFVRRKFNKALPHPKTISKWYRTVNGEPGLSLEALKSIKIRCREANYPLIGCLMFDGMHIRQMLQKNGGEFKGLVDFGSSFPRANNETPSLAKEAVVFMVNCMNQSWKIPIGYFLIDSLTSKQVETLINECLKALQDSNIKIVSLTFDGTVTNLTAAKSLVTKSRKEWSMKHENKGNPFHWWFKHPVTEDEIYVFLDPCHMLKLIRNTLGDMRQLKNANGEPILWDYFVQLHDLQESEGMHLANKVRSAHIQYFKQKMKVRLAAQIFSKSVADALFFCKNGLKLPEFQGCAATVEFIQNFNDLFDIFNTRTTKSFNFKQAVHAKNEKTIFNKLEEIVLYIQKLCLPNDQLVIESRRRTGFIGFLICIESLKLMYKKLVDETCVLKYIPTYKISQDHLETFFSCIRSHGGHNNNPTSQQFSAAFKKLLLHTDLRAATTGNCIPIEHISILHVTSRYTQSENIINSSSALYRLCDGMKNDWQTACDAIQIHSYVPDILQITEYSNYVIAYIAGFVAKHLRSKLYCETCIMELDGTGTTCESYSFINLKSFGGLHIPSKDVLTICQKSEKAIRFALKESGGVLLKPKYTEMYLTAMVFKEFIGNEHIFKNLVDHIHDATENHRVHLIRCIIQKYIKTRLFYFAKQSGKDKPSNRQFRTNLTQFEGR